MLIPYKTDQFEEILREIQSSNQDFGSKSIFYINGVVGSGKSTIVQDLLNTIENQSIADIVFRLNSITDIDYLVEFASALSASYVNLKDESSFFKFTQVQNNYNWFNEIYDHLKSISEVTGADVLSKILVNAQLRSKFDDETEDLDTEKIIPILKKEKDKNIIFDSGRITAEAFLVDLMSQFYPINKTTTFDDYIQNNNPLKVIIVLEDFYNINRSVNKFLAEVFFPLVFELSFNDFKFYRPAKNNYDLRISNFFDFKFIISGREIIDNKSHSLIESLFNDRFYEMYLDGFSKEQIIEYLGANGLNPELYIEDYEDLSHGNPLICKLLLDSIKKNNRVIDILQTYENLKSPILAIYSNKQKDFIEKAACFDAVNSKSIKFFVDRVDYKDAVKFFRNATELSDKMNSSEQNFIPLNFIKDCFSDLMSQKETEKFNRFNSYSYATNNLSPLFDKLSDQEFEIVRKLGYFTRFEPHFVSTNFFKYESDMALEVMETKKFAFYSNKFTKSVRYDYIDALRTFNMIVDGEDKYDHTIVEIKQLWDDYLFELNSKSNLLKMDVDRLNSELSDLEDEKNEKNEKYEKANIKFRKNEKRIKSIKSELRPFNEKKSSKTYTYFLIAGLILTVGSIVAFKFLQPLINDPLIYNSLIILLVILTLGTLGVSSVPLFRKLIYKIKKRELENLTLQLETSENNRLIFEEEVGVSTNELESVNAHISILKKKIEKLNIEIYDNKMRSQELFYVKEVKE